MHRDVSIKNMMVMSLNPLEAVLHDFGKTVKAEMHFNMSSALGPKATCAPEVKLCWYTRMIDVWAWAYAVLQAFGFCRTADEWITVEKRDWLQGQITAFGMQDSRRLGFAALLREMLTWDYSYRPEVEVCLAHVCWLSCWHDTSKQLQEDRPRKTPRVDNTVHLDDTTRPSGRVHTEHNLSGTGSTHAFSRDFTSSK